MMLDVIGSLIHVYINNASTRASCHKHEVVYPKVIFQILVAHSTADRNVLSSNPSRLFGHKEQNSITNILNGADSLSSPSVVDVLPVQLFLKLRWDNVCDNGARGDRVDSDTMAATPLHLVSSIRLLLVDFLTSLAHDQVRLSRAALEAP
jgi:hypothetical protein